MKVEPRQLFQLMTGSVPSQGHARTLLAIGGGTALIVLALARDARAWEFAEEVEADLDELTRAGLRLPCSWVDSSEA